MCATYIRTTSHGHTYSQTIMLFTARQKSVSIQKNLQYMLHLTIPSNYNYTTLQGDTTRSEMTRLPHGHCMNQNEDNTRTICKEDKEGTKHKQTTYDKNVSYKLRLLATKEQQMHTL